MNNYENDEQILRGILENLTDLLPKHSDTINHFLSQRDGIPSGLLLLAWLCVAKVEALHATEVVVERTLPSPACLRQQLDDLKSISQARNASGEMTTVRMPQIPPNFFPATIVPEFRRDASDNDVRVIVINLQKLVVDTPDTQKLGVDTLDPISWLCSKGQKFLDGVYTYAFHLGNSVRLQSPDKKDLNYIYYYLNEVWVRWHARHISQLDARRRIQVARKKDPVAIPVEDKVVSSATSLD